VLLQRVFRPWPRLDALVPARDHLRWKMASPASPVAAYIGRLGGKLVFAQTVVGRGVIVRGRRMLRIHYSDLVVDPSEQGKGLLSRALRYRYEVLRPTSDFAILDTKVPRVVHLVHSRGARALGNRITPRYFILDARTFAAEWLEGRSLKVPRAVVLGALGSAAILGSLRARRSQSGRRHVVRVAERLDDRIESFFAEAAAPYDLVMERSREYLEWRYLDQRAGPFTFLVVEEGDRILGYLVLRLAQRRAQIADLLVLPGCADVAEALIAEAVASARRAGAGGVACWLPSRHPYSQALRRQGFFDSRRDAHIHYQPFDASPETLAFLDRPDGAVHFVYGDTDLL
jgi:GNAT superfamily N-acetyltransferase